MNRSAAATLVKFPLTMGASRLFIVAWLILCNSMVGWGAELDWDGNGQFRIIVTLPVDTQVAGDERPADVAIDFQRELTKLKIQRRADIGSIQVIRYEATSGKPVMYPGYAYGRSVYDRPFRWYDSAIPYEFPEFGDAISRSKGKIVRRPKIRGGYFFNAIGDWKAGRLAWLHTTDSKQPSTYAIYFDLLAPDEAPSKIPPRGWLGDGLPRCDLQGQSTMGADHCRVDLDDWNGDGLVDLIVGEHYGHLFWWPNLGTKTTPKYQACRFIFNEEGLPLDTGLAAAPKIVDWDGDGRKDLLVGVHWNRMLYYRNVGTQSERRFRYEGQLMIDGKPLEVPIAPLERGSTSVFKRDYYPVPEVADWDNDGDLDLLLGGYVTGRIFLYETTGRHEDGTPILVARGPISADGKPLNVKHWCASPCVADFDNDGDLDLMSGSMPMHVKPEERAKFKDAFLIYFEQHRNSNDADGAAKKAPEGLRRTSFPKTGDFPGARLATPRAFDWDADGDLDLVVSARMNIYLFENTGSPTKPLFDVHSRPIEVPWGLASLPADQFRDWNQDGKPDQISGYTVRLNDGVGNPYRWTTTEQVLPTGETITHWSGMGDDWYWPFLDDFDEDGRTDVLFGDWHGHVWFHQNRSNKQAKRFDLQGERFHLESGTPLKVGPINKDPAKDFDALQGARTVFTTGDFDRDGRRDLVVGDTYGKIRWFRSLGPNDLDGKVRFAEPVELGDLGIRGLVDASDWNSDGWLDVIASAANGKVRVFLNQGDQDARRVPNSGSQFCDGVDPKLPPIVQPRVLMVDLNGDGDKDLFLPSTQGSCFVERSFLDAGYASGTLLRVERRE